VWLSADRWSGIPVSERILITMTTRQGLCPWMALRNSVILLINCDFSMTQLPNLSRLAVDYPITKFSSEIASSKPIRERNSNAE
jgi:hypothetical protein